MKQNLLILLFSVLLFSSQTFAQGLVRNPEQVSINYELVISPNPVEDKATFKVTEGQYQLTEIRVYDLIGKEQFAINIANGSGEYIVDFSNLRPGVYFCTIFSSRGVVETRKLVRANK